jgi:hypothetical protein
MDMPSKTLPELMRAVIGYRGRPASAPAVTDAGASRRRTAALQVLAYYAALLAALVVLGRLFTFEQGAVSPGGAPLPAVVGKLFEGGSPVVSSSRQALLTTLSMIAALALAIPIARVYAMTKRPAGCDLSVVQTLFTLPVAVAAIAMLVQNSLPLAFSLAGIVAAVRFRNTLKDAADAVYIFVAIGIGLAAGVQAFSVATVMSALFSAIVLATGGLKMGSASNVHPARRAQESEGHHPHADEPEPGGAKKGPKALLVVQLAPRKPAWRAVEDVLQRHTRRWHLRELPAGGDAEAPLEYRIQLKRRASLIRLLDEVRGGSGVLGAELRLIAG